MANFKIDGLDGYFGGKGGDGTYQQIINLIPKHKRLIVPFLGHCGVVRNMALPRYVLLNDIDKNVTDKWQAYINSRGDLNFDLYNEEFEFFLGNYQLRYNDVFIYADPPYPFSTRKSGHRYAHEMTDADHEKMLYIFTRFMSGAKIMISTYDNELYQNYLKGWNKHSFTSQTRNGVAVETVYFNYEPPSQLQDYSFVGNDYKEREQYRLKRARLVAKFERMTPLEQNYYLEALKDNFRHLF